VSPSSSSPLALAASISTDLAAPPPSPAVQSSLDALDMDVQNLISLVVASVNKSDEDNGTA
jgi:hypothetical protein